MRLVSDDMHATWLGGDFTGPRRPIARATIQSAVMVPHETRVSTFNSFILDQSAVPKELPNVKSVSWQRGTDQDAAMCKIELYNCEPLPVGETLTPEMDQLGYYTYNRGRLPYSPRWGHTPNEWQDTIVPDRVIRTFEGYGFDATKIPELDEHLIQTGTWLIDDVEFTPAGLIVLTCRDLARILIDQICFPPVIPPDAYPISFTTVPKPSSSTEVDPDYAGPAYQHIPAVAPVPGPGSGKLPTPPATPADKPGGPVKLSYSSDSGKPYYGVDGAIYGHHPDDAFDGDTSSYWLSVGNARPDAGYSYEFIEGKCGNTTLTGIEFETIGSNYKCWISIYADGNWLGSNVIPYDPANPVSAPNGSNIKYFATVSSITSKTLKRVIFSKKVEKVTKVRLTFSNLWDSGIGTYQYRAAVREFHGVGLAPVTKATATKTTTGGGTKVPNSKPGVPAKDVPIKNAEPAGWAWTLGYPVPGKAVNNTELQLTNVLCMHWTEHLTAHVYGKHPTTGALLDMHSTIIAVDPDTHRANGNFGLVGDLSPYVYDHIEVYAHNVDDEGNNDDELIWEDYGQGQSWQTTKFPDVLQLGTYADYTDIVKIICAWGGWLWREHGHVIFTDGSQHSVDWTFPDDFDPAVGARVWGDFEDTGTAGIADLTANQFDKKPLMDVINTVRDIIGFIFYVDEAGAVVWRSPNIWSVGNYVGNSGAGAIYSPNAILTIDDETTLLSLSPKLSSRNVREKIVVGNVDGKIGWSVAGYNPYPANFMRISGWTDQNFASDAEAEAMGELIALRQMFMYRTDSVTIAGYPAIQVDDQIEILERASGEAYLHHITSISSSLDMESGQYTFQMQTHWLGDDPATNWAFDLENLKQTLVNIGGADPSFYRNSDPSPVVGAS